MPKEERKHRVNGRELLDEIAECQQSRQESTHHFGGQRVAEEAQNLAGRALLDGLDAGVIGLRLRKKKARKVIRGGGNV